MKSSYRIRLTRRATAPADANVRVQGGHVNGT